jgi:hypothetical protein
MLFHHVAIALPLKGGEDKDTGWIVFSVPSLVGIFLIGLVISIIIICAVFIFHKKNRNKIYNAKKGDSHVVSSCGINELSLEKTSQGHATLSQESASKRVIIVTAISEVSSSRKVISGNRSSADRDNRPSFASSSSSFQSSSRHKIRMPADENRASRCTATVTEGTAFQSSAHKGILNKGRDRYEWLTHSGAHTMISNLGEVRKSAEREKMPDKEIKFNTKSASTTAVAYKVKGERSGDDKFAHFGVLCEGTKSVERRPSTSSSESSTRKVVLEMSADRDCRLTQNDARKIISSKRRKSIDRDKTPTSASSLSLSSMQKRSAEMDVLKPSQSQSAAAESYHGMLQRLSVVMHKAKRGSPSLVGAAGGDSTETSTKGSMFRLSNYFAGIHDIISTSSIAPNLEEDEVPEATSSIHQMAVVRDQLGSCKQKSMLIGNILAASADYKKTTAPDCNKGLAKVSNDKQRKVDDKNARMKKNTVRAEKGAGAMLASPIDRDLPRKDGEFMPPSVSVLREKLLLAEKEDEDPTALSPQVRDNNIVGMKDSKTITNIASSESFFKENSWKSDSVTVFSRTENAEELNMSNMAEAKEDVETKNEQAWESVLSGRKE